MKKRLFTALGLLIAGIAGAQTQKGNGLISGDVSISYSRADDQRGYANRNSSRSTLELTAGRFVADNWLLGGHVSGRWGSSKSENSVPVGQMPRVSNEHNSSANMYITPFVRRYWQFASVQVFAGAGLSIGVSGTRVSSQGFSGINPQLISTDQRDKVLRVGPFLEAGVNYFLTNRLALQLSVSSESLPLEVADFSTGLVYWTGTDRKVDPQQARENLQTDRGNWIVEGGFFASHTSTSGLADNLVGKSSSRSFSISPSVGYFIGKNNLLGIDIPATFSSVQYIVQNPQSSAGSSFWSVGISPYFQHYWASTRLTPYTRVGATYYTFGAKQRIEDTENVNLNAALSVGLAYMAGKRFIIETSLANASLAYSSANGPRNKDASWDATLSAGLRGNFAVRYVLTRPD